MQISDELFLVPVTLFFKNQDLTYEEISSGVSHAAVDVYGRVETIQGHIEYAFEDTVQHEIKQSHSEKDLKGVSVYQKRVPLRPGRYKLSLVVRDTNSGHMSTTEQLDAGQGCSSYRATKKARRA